MSFNLQLLGLQSIHRIAGKLNLKVNLPRFSELFGFSPTDFQLIIMKSEFILKNLFKNFKISWWDVYINSDIGMERMLIAKELNLSSSDALLDVGCGRGYFAIAAAKHCDFVVAIDLMNGFGRIGWWDQFSKTMEILGLHSNVCGVRANGVKLPLRNSSFTVAAIVHSIRNFHDKKTIFQVIREMKRVVIKGGSIIIVENLPIAKNKAQEAHLKMYRCKVKYSSGELYYMSRNEIVEIIEKVGFRDFEVNVVDYNLSSTPPLFYLNPDRLADDVRENALKEFRNAVESIKVWGEASPPAIFIRAMK